MYIYRQTSAHLLLLWRTQFGSLLILRAPLPESPEGEIETGCQSFFQQVLELWSGYNPWCITVSITTITCSFYPFHGLWDFDLWTQTRGRETNWNLPWGHLTLWGSRAISPSRISCDVKGTHWWMCTFVTYFQHNAVTHSTSTLWFVMLPFLFIRLILSLTQNVKDRKMFITYFSTFCHV